MNAWISVVSFYSCVGVYLITMSRFIYSFIDSYLVSSFLLQTVLQSMYLYMLTTVMRVFLVYIPKCEIGAQCGMYIFNFTRYYQVSKIAELVYSPISGL